MIKNLLPILILVGFFGLLLWGTHYETPTAVHGIKPIEHNIVTHELVCVTEKNNYCYRYEIRRIVKE